MDRYIKQLKLNKIGLKGQAKIEKSKVLVVGVGGLGSAVLPYLISSGIGTVGIVDGDNVELSNLPRQVIFNEDDIGFSKVDRAFNKLKKINNKTKIIKYNSFINDDNVKEIFKNFDIIVDATDSINMRYLINDACVQLKLPFVYGAVYKFQGQVSSFNYNSGPTYRCLFPNQEGIVENCEDAGVLGSTVGLIGMFQLNEVIKIILKFENVLSGKLLIYNTLLSTQYFFNFKKSEQKKVKGISESNYISFNKADKIKNTLFLDVREKNEIPKIYLKNGVNIPLNELSIKNKLLKKSKNIVIFCQSGKRSKIALNLLKENEFLNLKLMTENAIEISRIINKK